MILIFVCVTCSIVGYYIGDSKGRATAGLLLGLLTGFFGLLIIWALPPKDDFISKSNQHPMQITGFKSSAPSPETWSTTTQTPKPSLEARLDTINALLASDKISLEEWNRMRDRIFEDV